MNYSFLSRSKAPDSSHPLVIQGGMGANISNWLLAKTVSQMGQLGVVSGTALDLVLARRLQLGDPGGDVRRAMSRFPVPEMAHRVMDRYFIPGGKAENEPFKEVPMFSVGPPVTLQELTVTANFVEVFLAKEGHNCAVGINYLEKIQLPNLISIYGAMLAGVDYIFMGAGIPREIPGVIDRLADHNEVSLTLNVEGATGEDDFKMRFNPQDLMGIALPALKRPKFVPIIASAVLAVTLAKKSNGRIDGFVIEGPAAGGHNALPRGPMRLNDRGEPIYGEKDDVNIEKIKDLGLPFWLAGSFGTVEKLQEALEIGANGIQVGTAFAFCKESGLSDDIKQKLIDGSIEGRIDIFTDPKASPTGFPLKIVRLEGTISEEKVYRSRARVCDLGYLRQLYKKKDGSIGYRCPAEPVEHYAKKEGKLEDTTGCKCLCNCLMANIGLAQRRKNGYIERPLVTAGNALNDIRNFIREGSDSYSAEDVVNSLLGIKIPQGF